MTIRPKNGPEGLEITLRPGTNWLLICIQVFGLLLLAFIVFNVGLTPTIDRLRSGSTHLGDWAGNGVILLIFAAILVAILYAIAKQLFGYERVIVSEHQLTIEAWIAPLKLSSRTFPNNTVENLRYEEWPGGRAGTQSALRFESAGETIAFARQVDSNDCYEAIDQLKAVCKFPVANDDSPSISPAVTRW